MPLTTETHTTVYATHHFEFAPDRVFDAWLDPAAVAKWMLAPGPGEMGAITVDAKAGGTFSFVVRRQGDDVAHVGEYLAFDRPRRLSFTWLLPRYSQEVTVVSLDFSETATGTDVSLTHGPVLAEHAAPTAQAWQKILAAIDESLKS